MPIRKYLIGCMLLIFFLLPAIPASAAFFSFGGRVVTVVPCLSGLGPSLHITIIPAGTFAPAYIWTPATLTFLFGPPRNPGQQVLGLADVPFLCLVGKVPLFGLRMFSVGTSLVL